MIFVRSVISFIMRKLQYHEAKLPFMTSVVSMSLLSTVEYENSVGINSNISFKTTYIVAE